MLPGSGHMIFVEAPEQFREAVLGFLLGAPRLIEQAVAALREGRPAVLPTDTVYGLCGDPHRETAAREIYRLKQRPAEQPLALLAKDVDTLVELVPELPRAALERCCRGRTRSCSRTRRSASAG